MRYRPRYSLLTLLVLTAFVAGGVKLWYGPHHVVERPTLDQEVEYTYTRDWRGNKLLQGACILRMHAPAGIHFTNSTILFYHQGVQLPWVSRYLCVPENFDLAHFPPVLHTVSPANRDTYELFQKAVEIEKQALRPLEPGLRYVEVPAYTNQAFVPPGF